MFLWSSTASDTHTRTRTFVRRVYVHTIQRRVRFYRKGGPECSLLHLFRANSPLKTAYASYHRLLNRLAFFFSRAAKQFSLSG